MIAPARAAAYDALRALTAGRADLSTALELARARLSDPRDRALATDIASGVQRWRARLDHAIAACSRRPLEALDPEVVDILRLSVYQLLYLDRVPAAAVVDDAVNMAGRAGKASARGFVNAVLRSVSRVRGRLPLPPRPPDASDRDAAIDYLAISLSHPRWLVERWMDRFGFEAAERWLEFNNTPAPLTLRANRIRTSPDALRTRLEQLGVEVTAGRYGPDALLLTRGDRRAIEALESLHGDFVVQDEASQLVTLLAGPNPGPRVLDTCASPGGKTTAFAAAQGGAGFVVACDVRSRRMQLLRRTVEASGARRVYLVQADALQPLPFRTTFDCVFVDAPCSGLGTLQRDPDIKWRRTPADLAVFADAQRRMLAHAAELVVPGGRLIYATCSSEPEENEEVAGHFGARSGFRRLDARRAHPAIDAALVDAAGDLRTTPHAHQLAAFYGAVFERPPSEL
jgi:16S rRNA (cytosine967-C5)-methyltransferase